MTFVTKSNVVGEAPAAVNCRPRRIDGSPSRAMASFVSERNTANATSRSAALKQGGRFQAGAGKLRTKYWSPPSSTVEARRPGGGGKSAGSASSAGRGAASEISAIGSHFVSRKQMTMAVRTPPTL